MLTNLWKNSFSGEFAERHFNKTTQLKETCDRADPALTAKKKSPLFGLRNKQSEAFSASAEELGRTNIIYHTINIGDSGPVRQGMRRIPHEQIVVLKTEVDKFQSALMAKPSFSPFATPNILVKMTDGSWLLCIAYRKLNSVTKNDANPLPRIEDIFDTRAGSKFVTTLDLAMGYHQVEVHPGDL